MKIGAKKTVQHAKTTLEKKIAIPLSRPSSKIHFISIKMIYQRGQFQQRFILKGMLKQDQMYCVRSDICAKITEREIDIKSLNDSKSYRAKSQIGSINIDSQEPFPIR